ncbi:TetR/AcrR family transcriptional regulator [Actinomycetospora endophytica]|uniref:TetR/AcrR family transcriptional regulator n=1 Tax=Actinomycetospora endophytica TaxID=2291215 RepID=A0ABS8P2U9_9PSEU|nr:TetR/AcrR family transcriptional regulator [Actinomycetospora endophytica]MCD2192358.1 TetR/AcrR family transcriptional regulator [Actinomycetospora endophytica]
MVTVTDDDGPRPRIVDAAARLLEDGGSEAVSTRAVSAAAGVQAPTIYRLFGDKQGLLDAVVSHGFETYLAEKMVREESDDPVADLRAGWDLHIGLALERPALYTLMYARPDGAGYSPAARAAFAVLAALVRRIAVAGRLRVAEGRAVGLVHSTGTGTALSLIAVPPGKRDPGLSDAAREAVIAAITTDAPAAPEPGPLAAAISLRAALDQVDVLTDAERALLAEWLDKVASGPVSTT